MLQLEVIPRSLSAMYRLICPLAHCKRMWESKKKCRRKAHDPINFQITPRKGAPRMYTAPVSTYIGTYEPVWRGNKRRNCLSQHAFRDTDVVFQLVKAIRRTHISLHWNETFQRYRRSRSLCCNVFNMYLRSPEALQQSGANHCDRAGGRYCVKMFIRDPLALTSRKRSL